MKKTSHKRPVRGNRSIKVVASRTINRSAEDLFNEWRHLENLQRFMKNLVSVTQTSPSESHWVAITPGGRTIEWDAEIFNEHANELIAWRTKEGSVFPHAGSVRFSRAPGDRGTEVTVAMEYNVPGGKVGQMVAKMLSFEPQMQIAAELSRFKAWMETGEIPNAEGQPVGGVPKPSRKAA